MRVLGLAVLLMLAGCVTSIDYAQNVSLVGVIEVEPYLGPPNYGETPELDEHENAYILRLDHAVSIRAGGDLGGSARSHVERMQIVGALASQSTLLGHHVRVRGAISPAVTGHDRTDVVLQANAIEPF